MKKEIVIKVLKGVGAVVVTGLGIRSITKIIELKRRENQLVKELCGMEIDIKVNQAVMDIILKENELLFDENISLRNPEPKKKKV